MLDFFARKKSCRLLVNVEGRHVERYNRFRDFLTHNYDALGAIAELEQIYHSGSPFGMAQVRPRFESLSGSVLGLAEALDALSGGRYPGLAEACRTIESAARAELARTQDLPAGPLVVPLAEVGSQRLPFVGAKAGNLARLGNSLGIPIPQGFAITAQAFELFLDANGLGGAVQEALERMDLSAPADVEAKCRALRGMILSAQVPQALAEALRSSHAQLAAATRPGVLVAVRSSAVGEDTEASFAGQYASVLNVAAEGLLDAYKTVLASKYTPHAVLYRLRYGLEDRDAPMCVLVIEMVESFASGVAYTRDPSNPGADELKVTAILGLGELLVGGEASPDVFVLERASGRLLRSEVARKPERLVCAEGGGTRLEPVPEDLREKPAIGPEQVQALFRHALALEGFFGKPQDVEWAVDGRGRLAILQSRPLGLEEVQAGPARAAFEAPLLLSGGKTASRGVAAGSVVLAEGDLSDLPAEAILVARTTSPSYAALAGRIRGLVADVGSVASHLASVLREFGVPALVDAGDATKVLAPGETVTLDADGAAVYRGLVPELLAQATQRRARAFDTPAHRRLRALLDRVSPLNLTDPKAPEFAPEGCKTLHDIIRFAHEKAMRAMFALSGQAAGGAATCRLKTNIPLDLYLVDLGGGLNFGLTTCDAITPEHIESLPMRAVWKGFTHPGITWSGAVGVDIRNAFTLFASSMVGAGGPEGPGGDSYAILAADYLNLSAKFGYHFANIDALCGEDSAKNYVTLQFAGGAGSYLGKSMRVNFLAAVLKRLGFAVTMAGDLVEGSLCGLGRADTEQALDQLARLLASSRLLDMAISGQNEVASMAEAFFREEYDFLGQANYARLPGFYTHTGEWSAVESDGRTCILQDGSRWGTRLSSGVSGLMSRMLGPRYQEFLDDIEAYCYFPVAVARNSEVADARIAALATPVAGGIDRACGVVFGLKNVGNYLVFRLNALEDNALLFEFVNNRRFERASVTLPVATGRTYRLEVEVQGGAIRCLVDGAFVLGYDAGRPVTGYVGLWTKADSVTRFGPLLVEAAGTARTFGPECVAPGA